MKWLDCLDRMDQQVIKKDGTAVDVEYFMATHVPFRDLEFVEFGDTETKAIHLNEEEIYDGYIVNRSNKHQMLIVRGTNGSGKSHLICWLHNRYISDNINYNKDKEKVIFLRRLSNTVRGAVQQMLDEGIVQDTELKDKFVKFCSAAESQSEEEFKTSIYNEYAKRVLNDGSNTTFKKVICKDIAAFLFDSRVQEYMMRPAGPVDKCYQMITSGAKTIVTDETETIFTVEDFKFPKDIAKAIKKNAAEEVKNYYLNDLRDDEAQINRLVIYLNHFTSKVIQSCANITSENARDLFVNLRKSLKNEGKNLTIFIEDFTSFSIVESELITALSAENGGQNSDLCRVTSVIGITDGYYDSFRDNFKDRVTKQIKVTEQSYGGKDFLIEMAARYLNAIYCTPEAVKSWYRGAAVGDTMPTAEFIPEYEWDSVQIGEQKYTLYPFNIKSLLSLYDKLKVKTPRNFLFYIIQHFFAQFADGMEYGDSWEFPDIPPYISSVTLESPYADAVESSGLSDLDKQRAKVLFSIWGNGTTAADEQNIGGISKLFLNDISLKSFVGVGQVQPVNKSSEREETNKEKKEHKKISQEEIAFNRKKEDILGWFEEKKTLEYSSDYNKWLGNFVVQSIAWQDEGYLGEFVTQRLRNGNFVDIEDSKLETDRNNAVVVLERNSESRTILMGLALFDYHKNWDFVNAEYYQLILINWLEKNKKLFVERILGDIIGKNEHPVLTWCLAIEYLQRLLLGDTMKFESNEELLRYLVRGGVFTGNVRRSNQDWNDVLTYLENQSAKRATIKNYLISGSKTIMGIVGERSESKVQFYRTSELHNSMRHLVNANWNICGELEGFTGKHFDSIRKHLQTLYAKINIIVESEKKLAKKTIHNFEKIVGKQPTKEKYIEIVNAIREFYAMCGVAHEVYDTKLKIKFDRSPSEQAHEVLAYYDVLKAVGDMHDCIELLEIFSTNPIEKMENIINDLMKLEQFAINMKNKHLKLLGPAESIDPIIVEGALTKLEEVSKMVDELEVFE